MTRIVSLIASATEIACALGLRESLVGRSHECDTPENITRLPALTSATFDTSQASAGIDRAVKNLVADGLAVYRVDRDLLRHLAPDVILTQDQCEVCAASLKDVEAAVCDWIGHTVQIVSLHPNCLDDIWRDIETVGTVTGSGERARQLTTAARKRLSALTPPATRPRVLCVEWIDPPMSGGHWIPEVVAFAGGEALLAPVAGPSPYISLDQITAADADVVIVAPCGFDVARSASEMHALDSNAAWRDLRAVRGKQVFIADGNRFFNRPSLAVVETAEIVRDILDQHEGNRAHRRFGEDVWRIWEGVSV